MTFSMEFFWRRLGHMFYVIHPDDMAFSTVEEDPPYVTHAIPYFFLLIFVEMTVCFFRGYKAYYFKDTVMSVSLGIMQQVVGLWIKALGVIPYMYLYTHFRVFDIPTTGWLPFIGVLLGCDFCYYVYHRTAHEWHVLWSGHSVHHSGQHYNLATALRQGSNQPAASWIPYLLLAILGFPPGMV